MDNEKSLKSKENKKLEQSKSQQKNKNNRNFRKLNINLSSYYKLTKNNDNTFFKKNIFKNNKHNSTEIKDNQNKKKLFNIWKKSSKSNRILSIKKSDIKKEIKPKRN